MIFDVDGDDVVAAVETDYQTAEFVQGARRKLHITTDDAEIINDDTDKETVTVSVVDGLEVARGTDPTAATVLDYNGDVTISVDGAETTKTLSNGSVSFSITTSKPDRSVIKVEAVGPVDHPAESDSAVIEVVSA